MVGFHDPGGSDLVTQYGAELGKDFACIRVYMKPSEWGTVSPEFRQIVAAGKLAVASHKPPNANDAWANVVRGVYDTEIAAIIEAHKKAAIETIFMFNHEPHDECSDLGHDASRFRGTSSEYRAAFQYIVDRFRTVDARNVRIGYCGTDPGIFGSPDACYPGDEFVDVLCHDLYNWGDFRSDRDAWTEFDDPTRMVPQRRSLPGRRPRREPLRARSLLLPFPAGEIRLPIPQGADSAGREARVDRWVFSKRLLRLETSRDQDRLKRRSRGVQRRSAAVGDQHEEDAREDARCDHRRSFGRRCARRLGRYSDDAGWAR